MSNVEPRLAPYPTCCPQCKHPIARGELMLPVKRGTTETTGCAACFWADYDAQTAEEDAS